MPQSVLLAPVLKAPWIILSPQVPILMSWGLEYELPVHTSKNSKVFEVSAKHYPREKTKMWS